MKGYRKNKINNIFFRGKETVFDKVRVIYYGQRRILGDRLY